MSDIQFHAMPDGRRIAFRKVEGKGPALVFLPGYMSDMDGSKATALFDWARKNGRSCLLLDYSGCGRSDGDFADGTLSKWRDEVTEVIKAQVAGKVVLSGSSMGGWLMLLAARARPEQVKALVGIAPAPDFTDDTCATNTCHSGNTANTFWSDASLACDACHYHAAEPDNALNTGAGWALSAMVALLGKESIIALLVLPHESFKVLHLRGLPVLLDDSLVEPLRPGNGIAKHGLLVLHQDPLLHLAHDPHLQLLLEELVS